MRRVDTEVVEVRQAPLQVLKESDVIHKIDWNVRICISYDVN